MKQRGRRSASSLAVIAVDGKPPRLNPPETLGEPERVLFTSLVAANSPEHFRPSDLPLLCRYCEASILAEQAAGELRHGAVIDGRPSPWLVVSEKSTRALVALSMRLRLSPQSRIDPKTIARHTPHIGPRPWER